MAFAEWAATIVSGVRHFIPEVVVMRQGEKRVIIRHDGQTCMLVDDGAFWVRFGAGVGTPMASLFDAGRRDLFTCSNFERSIAGHFDASFSVRPADH